MDQNCLSHGKLYFVSQIVRTKNAPYVILMTIGCSRFLPIITTTAYSAAIEDALSVVPNKEASIPLFVTFSMLLKAVNMTLGRFSLMLADDGMLSVVLDLYQSNEASVCVGRVPVLPQDACVLSAITDIPFAIFERSEDPITIAIDKKILCAGPQQVEEFIIETITGLEAKFQESQSAANDVKEKDEETTL